MSRLALATGTIDYVDTGGDGPTVVLLHGLLMDGTLWAAVVDDLAADHRCVVPTLPLGAHRRPFPAGADLSLPAVATLVEDLLDHLGLTDVTVVGNDTGGAVAQLLMARRSPRVGRVVLASCEAFDNIPPGLTGRTLVLAGRLPPFLFGALLQQMRLRPLRRLPMAFGWLTKRGDRRTRAWLTPIFHQRGIRRDAVKVLRAMARHKGVLVEATDALSRFDRPALIVWAEGDRVMPPDHGRRLAELLPHARLVEVDDSSTLIPLDQPATLAGHVRDFVAVPAAAA